MQTHDSYVGIKPFTVLVDASPQLESLVSQARELRSLPFDEKLQKTKQLTHQGIPINAYEQMIVLGDKADGLEGVKVIDSNGKIDNSEYELARKNSAKFEGIVFEEHPLSHALQERAGCCRYQGALFFVLGYEAGLGDRHFIQSAPVNKRANTVFNEIIENEAIHKISIFTESLRDKSHDYSLQNPLIFEQAHETLPGYNFYSYHRTPSGLVIVSENARHVKSI